MEVLTLLLQIHHTAGVACVNTNRNFIGIEKDENYFKIAEERINSKNLFTK
jgi:site-specific DNA-methyltransferase (adenine-specific)